MVGGLSSWCDGAPGDLAATGGSVGKIKHLTVKLSFTVENYPFLRGVMPKRFNDKIVWDVVKHALDVEL